MYISRGIYKDKAYYKETKYFSRVFTNTTSKLRALYVGFTKHTTSRLSTFARGIYKTHHK